MESAWLGPGGLSSRSAVPRAAGSSKGALRGLQSGRLQYVASACQQKQEVPPKSLLAWERLRCQRAGQAGRLRSPARLPARLPRPARPHRRGPLAPLWLGGSIPAGRRRPRGAWAGQGAGSGAARSLRGGLRPRPSLCASAVGVSRRGVGPPVPARPPRGPGLGKRSQENPVTALTFGLVFSCTCYWRCTATPRPQGRESRFLAVSGWAARRLGLRWSRSSRAFGAVIAPGSSVPLARTAPGLRN